jgi:outer membrane protein OmpA-like peptidoglycan-associated protein/Tol biopolymer transport system component
MNNRKTHHVFYLLILFSCLKYNPSFAQNNRSAAEKLYQKALVAFDEQQYDKCIPLLEKSIQTDPSFIDPVLTLFQVNLDLKKYTAAIPIYNKAVQLDAMVSFPYFIKQAAAFASIGDYTKAKELILGNLNNEKMTADLKVKALNFLTICNYAIAYPSNDEISIHNLGDSINTAAPEYFPYFSIKDSVLFFMRKLNIRREDFYTSTLTTSGFTKAKLLEDSINFADKKGSVSFLPDMQTLYFAADYPEQGYGRYDIYKSVKAGNYWTTAKNLGRNVNTDYWDSAPSISPDGKALYFSSNRPGGLGGIDLYIAFKNEKGGWEEAINLGPQINTSGDEQTPFIHADNNSLYFSSTGWPGYGGADFFVVHQKIDGNWTKPLNLGYPINTFDNEGSIAVASNGVDAYIASDRSDSRGGLDIYKVTLSKATRANKKFFLKGIIKDANSKKAISAVINLVDLTDQSSFTKIEVDSNGQFIFAIPYLDSVGIIIASKFYEEANRTITSASFDKDNTSNHEFYLSAIKKQFTQTFKNVLFATDAATLLPGSEKELNELVAYLIAQPTATILIEGHTDNTGDANKNKILSLGRAKSIAQFLMGHKIQAQRITTIGYGDTKPIASNDTEQGRQQNRRTSFTISIPK